MFGRSESRQLLAMLSNYIQFFHMGTAYAWAASHMNYFLSKEGHGFTYEECTMVASLLHMGRLCAPIANLLITGRFGRKPALVFSSFLMAIAGLMQTVSKSTIAIYTARCLMGFGVGTCDCFGMMYQGEIASKHVRGIFLTLNAALYAGGILLQYILAYYLTFEETSAVTSAIAICHVLFTYFVVESPYFLVEKGKLGEASKILSWLRAREEKQVEGELDEISSIEKVSNYSEFFTNFTKPEVYKSYGIILTLGIVGSVLMTTIVGFANYMVPDTGFMSSNHFGMLLCVIPACSNLISTVYVERWGRRPLLIGSLFLETILNALIASLFLLQQQFHVEISHFPWIVFALVVVLFITYSIGTYPIILATRSELFPPSYKVLGFNICIGLNSLTNFVYTVFFMEVVLKYGMYLNYAVFSASCLIGLLIVYFLLPFGMLKMTLSKEALHQTMAIIPVGFNELAMGLGNGWLAPTLRKLQDTSNEIPLTLEQCSWIGSLHEFGRFFGPLFLGLILDKLGRKILLIICALIFFLMWLALLYTNSIPILYITRFIFGIGIGICDVTSSIYLAENCSPKFRGIFSSITVISFYVGMLLEFFLATYLNYKTVIILNLVVAMVGLLSNFLLRETPHFLMLHENYEQAGITLQWLKGSILWNDVNEEFEQIKHNVAEEKCKSSFQELFSTGANYKSIAIGFVLNLLVMSTGYATIIAFASLIFPPSGLLTPYGFTIFYGIDQLIAVCVSIFVIERFDRRVLILFSFSMFAIIHACTAALYYFHIGVSSELYAWLVFSTVTVYGSIYTFLYPVIHIIRGELFPQSVRAVGSCLAIMAHSGMGFLSAKTFLMVDTYLGIYTNFIIFSVASIVGFIYTYFVLPETRGKSLIDIQKSFAK